MKSFLDFLRSEEFAHLPTSETQRRLNRFLEDLDEVKQLNENLERELAPKTEEADR